MRLGIMKKCVNKNIKKCQSSFSTESFISQRIKKVFFILQKFHKRILYYLHEQFQVQLRWKREKRKILLKKEKFVEKC